MNKKKKLTPISELGKTRLIRHITADFRTVHHSSIKGIGDDAAVLDYRERTVITTDMLVEGIHFDLEYTPLKHLGYKSIVVGLSDVYAMFATPRQVMVSIAASGKFSVEALQEFYDGVKKACKTYKVDLVGGDTKSSITGLFISVTAMGELDEKGPVYRENAKSNDLVCVSGDLGAAYMGLQLLEREKRIFNETESSLQPELSGHEYILERQLKPEARKDIILALREQGLRPTAMIDVSDGLSPDLLHICEQSGLGCRIFQAKIPVAGETEKMASELGLEPIICALNGGEDYELLFTLPLNMYDKVMQIKGISIIGHMTGPGTGSKLISVQENEIDLQPQG